MIIFGWNRQTIWTLGAVFRQLCSNCHNEEYWVLIRRTTWFTLFFIPVIPYNTEWLLLCPVCKYGVKLGAEQVRKYKPLAEANKELSDGKINEAEYTRKVEAIVASPSSEVKADTTVVPAVMEVEANEIDQSQSKFCGECGKDLLPQGKFCTHCGTQTPNKSV